MEHEEQMKHLNAVERLLRDATEIHERLIGLREALNQPREKTERTIEKLQKEFDEKIAEVDRLQEIAAGHEEPGHESPVVLPIIAFQGTSTKYYWDARLGQVRNINNPHDYWDPKRSARASIEYFVQEGKMTMPFKYKEE